MRTCASRVTHDRATGGGVGDRVVRTVLARVSWGAQKPNPGPTLACVPVGGWGTFALTTDGSQKRVKHTGKLTKMADTNAPYTIGRAGCSVTQEFLS